MQEFSGSTCFATIDFVSGYWQLPFHSDSYGLCGIPTPNGVVASKRVLPGLCNTTSVFQSSLEPLFTSLRPWLKKRLDGFSLHAQDVDTLLIKLEKFFCICKRKNLFRHARKCILFDTELRWCGRIISGQGYRFDPSRIQGLQQMNPSETVDELSQFVHCGRRISICIHCSSCGSDGVRKVPQARL